MEISGEKFCHLNGNNNNRADLLKELKESREQTKLARKELELIKKHHREQLANFNEAELHDVKHKDWMREVFEMMRQRREVQDDLVKNLKLDLLDKNIQIEKLTVRNKKLEEIIKNYRRTLKGSIPTWESERRRFDNRRLFTHDSDRSSIVDYIVPPPPPGEPPAIEEILKEGNITTYESSHDDSFIDETHSLSRSDIDGVLLEQMDKKAFHGEEGQFVCHAYTKLESSDSQDLIIKIIESVTDHQRNCESLMGQNKEWRSVINLDASGDTPDSTPHVTLLRGHRVVYQHQIKSLVESVQKFCATIRPFSLCLDTIDIFNNYEKTKQFLCITVRRDQYQTQPNDVSDLKIRLQQVIDQFATRLTDEDETIDTMPHSSLMVRDVDSASNSEIPKSELEFMDKMLKDGLHEDLECYLKVEFIYLMIGNHHYKFKLCG